jgi:sarcosine oxidase subunit beta
MNLTTDVVIIGAGVIGCAIAFEMSKNGYASINVDKLGSAGLGSTSNSCAIIRYSYSTLEGVAMAYESKFYWENWPDYLEMTENFDLSKFYKHGGLYLNYDNPVTERILKHYKELGVKYEVWSNKKLHELIPFLDTSRFWPPTRPNDEQFWAKPKQKIIAAVFTPDAGFINDPQLSTQNLMNAAQKNGAVFLFNDRVQKIRKQSGRVSGVTLNSGVKIDSKIVVNASGPHSYLINRMADVESDMNIKTKPLRHEVHHLPSPKNIDFWKEGYYTSDGDNGIYFRPEVGNQILIGSEDPECDPREWVDNPDQYDTDLSIDQWKTQTLRLSRRLPFIEIPNKPSGIVDLYDVSDDWIPIYDKSILPGFYCAIGTSGNQYKNAPVVGKLMSKLITDCENGQDHDSKPILFTYKHLGREMKTSHFSRKREINTESSFSVSG